MALVAGVFAQVGLCFGVVFGGGGTGGDFNAGGGVAGAGEVWPWFAGCMCALDSCGATGDEGFEEAALDHFILLIEQFAAPNDSAASAALRRHLGHAVAYAEGIADVDGLEEFPVMDGEERFGLDDRPVAGGAGGPGEAEESVGDGSAEGAAFGGFMIDVERIEVAGVASKIDDIGFGDGASVTFPGITHGKVVEKERAIHGMIVSKGVKLRKTGGSGRAKGVPAPSLEGHWRWWSGAFGSARSAMTNSVARV